MFFYHLQEKSLRRTTEGLHGLCSQVIRTVFSGRNTDLAFENTGKIALIFESDRAGNFRQCHAAALQIQLAALNAQAVGVLGKYGIQFFAQNYEKAPDCVHLSPHSQRRSSLSYCCTSILFVLCPSS